MIPSSRSALMTFGRLMTRITVDSSTRMRPNNLSRTLLLRWERMENFLRLISKLALKSLTKTAMEPSPKRK